MNPNWEVDWTRIGNQKLQREFFHLLQMNLFTVSSRSLYFEIHGENHGPEVTNQTITILDKLLEYNFIENDQRYSVSCRSLGS